MSFLDVAKMAFHNLWSRKLRTTLNILGVVLACVILAMTFAGTKGVSDGFQKIIHESEDVRKFGIRRSWVPDIDVPEDVTRIDGEMSEDRRERIKKRLKQKWLRENADQVLMGEQELRQMRNVMHVQDVIPHSRLTCTLRIGDVAEEAGITGAPTDKYAATRVLAGKHLDPSDHNGILLGEFAAYRLGYVTDADLEALIGREIDVSIRVGGHKVAAFLQMMDEGLGELSTQAETMLAMKRLLDSIDTTSLSDREKELIREAFATAQPNPAEPLFLEQKYVVRGVVRESMPEDSSSFLRVVHIDTRSDVYMTSVQAARIEMDMEEFKSFYGAIGTVDDVEHLTDVVDEIEAMGFDVYSSKWIVKRIDEEIDKAKIAISVLCLLILVISAIGISNTMVVSVLERTSEFGILKAIGARDRSVLQLMLMEGALTGLLGAVVAIAISLGLARLAAVFVRKYVSEQIRQDYDGSIFTFAGFDLSIVLAVAVVVCTLAAIFPAYRAARLDPVVAMRRN